MRPLPKSLANRWKDPAGLIQVILGPRQVGKTTAVTEMMDLNNTVFASADLPTPPTTDFITVHWEKARNLSSSKKVLILDEIQKVPRWSEVVKKLWDEDKRRKHSIDVWILGSAAILIEKGLSESLTGRCEINYFPHWTFGECREVFGASVKDYFLLGGYPKAYTLREDPVRALEYIQNGILEPTLGRDILSLHSIEKPALLRQLFWYTSKLPAQIVSYEKILGHLQGKGNSSTLVHYAELLEMAFLLLPISKFSSKVHRTKRSLPKWIFPNPALVDISIREKGMTGFAFENLVGSHLANLAFIERRYSIHYWRDDDCEIDFVLADRGEAKLTIEVKSGRPRKIPDERILKSKGLECPLAVVSQENLERVLGTMTIAECVQELKMISI